MLLFYNASVSELPAARSAGIRDAAVSAEFRDGPDATLVIDPDKLPEPARDGIAPYVPPEAIANLDPYLRPKSVRAAGGVVLCGGEVVLIFRRGMWDLPKGKCDACEADADCALREVSEETGIADLRLRGAVGTTVHGYPRGGRHHVKTTVWYRMETSARTFVPQQVEGIERVECVPLEEARIRVGFPILRRLLVGVCA